MIHPWLAADLGGMNAASAEEEPSPRLIAWNLSRRCRRETCGACAIFAGPAPAPPGELSTIESLHLAQHVAAARPGILLLCGGDPLAREDVETIAAHAARRRALVAVATPSRRAAARRLASLQSAGVAALVVVEPAESHDEAAAASDAVARAREAGLRVVVAARVAAPTREIAQSLARRAHDEGAHALHVELAGDDRAATSAERELTVQARRLKPLAIRVTRAGAGCACDPLACRITADGKLTACPCASEGVADLRRRTFVEAWRTSFALAAQRAEASPIEPPPPVQLSLRLEAER